MLKRCPSESQKYIGIGGTVFFTGLMAAISSGYALYTVFDYYFQAVFFGLLWGLMIFNLDRFIVSSMRKKNQAWKEWKLAFPRLVFAGILAVVISKPIELRIFEKEINRKLDDKRTIMLQASKKSLEAVFGEVSALGNQKDLLRSEIQDAVIFRDKLQSEYDFERFGTRTDGTSGIIGLGMNARKKEEQLDAAQIALDKLREGHQSRIDRLDEEIRMLEQEKSKALTKLEPNIEAYDGLAARLDALSVLTTDSPAIKMAGIFIVLLFVAVETAPIFVKLISPRGSYDELLDLTEHKVVVYAKEETTKQDSKSIWRLSKFRQALD